MAKKLPARPNKAWTPEDPLKVDFHKVLQEHAPGNSAADRGEKADHSLFTRGGSVKHPVTSTNHKAHARQKKV
jgi:hypothetical protein